VRKTEAKFQNCLSLEGMNRKYQGLFSHRESNSFPAHKRKDLLLIMSLKKMNSPMFVISVNYPHHLIFMLERRQCSIMNQGDISFSYFIFEFSLV
jgi:hypothetical protein